MGVLHGDADIDLELQFNYWTIKIHTCLTTWIITNVLLFIFIYTLFYYIFFLHRVYKMTLCLITITYYILSWWSYDSGRPIPKDLHDTRLIYAGFTDQIS